MTEKLYTKGEVLQVANFSAASLDRLIRRGDLPIVRLGDRTIRITKAALDELIARRTEKRGGRAGGRR